MALSDVSETEVDIGAPEEELAWQELHTFRCTLPLQASLREVLRNLDRVDDRECLEVGAVNGAFSQQLRRRGGTWQSLATDSVTAKRVASVLEEDVPVLDRGLPFEKKRFDIIVIHSALERFSDDVAFIEDCHRVLKPDGRLLVLVARIKPYTAIRTFRSLFGVTSEFRGHVRPGYTELQLFAVLKNGFDVLHMKSYSRFFSEFVSVFVERLAFGRGNSGAIPPGRYPRRVLSIGGFFYKIAEQFDMLLLFNRGHRLVAVGKRRGWRPRDAPILVDGRSISEAVLSRTFQ
ncbi:MAG: SAM-dependent methyltransferase [Candidatus Promineifilaceae bacterium]|jgi:SAM-dependent methyltransferase